MLLAQLVRTSPDSEVTVDAVAALGLCPFKELFEDGGLVDHLALHLGLPGHPALHIIIVELEGNQFVLKHWLVFVAN